MVQYQQLESQFRKRVDTGEGDFSERLRLLSDNIVDRFSSQADRLNLSEVKSSELLGVVYGEDIATLRAEVLKYLKLKGFVLFLFDNLDRFWTPGGFNNDDAIILIGLAEAMQELSRRFEREGYAFRWILFLRSDVYEFLIDGMADYGKLATHSIEWSDRAQMKALFDARLIEGATGEAVDLASISVEAVDGRPTLEFLIDGSLMRPRYLIRLFETARRRALTLNRKKINEDDYRSALVELGWQCLEDLDREIVDLMPDAKNFLFEAIEHHDDLSPGKLKYIAGRQVANDQDIERLVDVMIWSGCLGVRTPSGDKYIFNTGYKRQYISSLIKKDDVELVIHPTLIAAVS
jgi:hypothetical protein